MDKDKKYMQLCLALAEKGIGKVEPNPMVGSVIVNNGKIIGKGYHKRYGGWHAEVNATNSVKNKKLLSNSTIYVNLEPCNHFGKTPPCTELIIRSKIPKVVIGNIDPNKIVRGKGIEKLRQAGCKVKVRILNKLAKELNKRFFTFHQNKRPYIILKWAQTSDGFIDKKRISAKQPRARISNPAATKLVHKWRSQEQSIMIGTNTALFDNPKLTVRYVKGRNPIRIVLDKDLGIPKKYHLLDHSTPTLVLTAKNKKSEHNLEYVLIGFKKDLLKQVLRELYKRNIQSLFVEGGAELLTSFIKVNLWDEARVIVSPKRFKEGVAAPKLVRKPYKTMAIKRDKIYFYRNMKK